MLSRIKRSKQVKVWRIIAVLLLSLILIGLISCNPFGGGDDTGDAGQPVTKVVRGDLTVTISGSGNIQVSNEIRLTFGIAGRIDKIYVQEGDSVSEGDVLAKLETDYLELALTQAQVAETTAQVAETTAQVAVTQAQVAVTQAQITLETTEDNLESTQDLYAKPQVYAARAAENEAESYLEYAKEQLAQASTTKDIIVWTNDVAYAEEKLRAAQVTLNEMLSGPDTEEVAIARLQVDSANQSLELSRQSLELASQSLELNEQSLQLAQESLELAQKQLDETTITATFDSIVATVAVDEKDTITTVTTIIHLIDPSSMELEVEVDEIDITAVKVGQKAIIELDAMPALPVEGTVSSISLLPAQGTTVVMYNVKVDFDIPEGSGLRAGMSATTDIIIAERSDVLLLPNQAIAQDIEGNSVVDVIVDEQSETRTVVTGVSDSFQTEIIEGLKEGEEVVERKARLPTSFGRGRY